MAAAKKKRRKKMNKQKKILLLSLLGIVLAGGIGFAIFAFTGRGKFTVGGAIRGYFKAIEAEDVDQYISICYPSAWSEHYRPYENDVDLTLLVQAVFAQQSGANVEDINIQREEKLEDVFVQRFEKKIREIYDVDISLSAVYRVYFTFGGGEEGRELARYVYKYKGKWYYLADSLLLIEMDLDE